MCRAWLGPAYQVVTACRAIRAGCDQQPIHRDYREEPACREESGLNLRVDISHWGPRVTEFPLATHIANQFLTLQIAVALNNQPLSMGPTRFLPYSNQLATGYVNIRRPEFSDWVRSRTVQLPLDAGDVVVFNPTTFHQPGINETNVHRVMHLFQVNSCMSRPMDVKDTLAMTKAVWPTMKKWSEEMKTNSNEVGVVSS